MPFLGSKMQRRTRFRIAQMKAKPHIQKTGQRCHIVTPRRSVQGKYLNRGCLLLHGLSLDRHTRPNPQATHQQQCSPHIRQTDKRIIASPS